MKIEEERKQVNFVSYVFIIFLGFALGFGFAFFIRKPISNEDIALCKEAYQNVVTYGDMSAFINGKITMQTVAEDTINLRSSDKNVRGCVVLKQCDDTYEATVDYELDQVLTLGLICGGIVSVLGVALKLIKDFAGKD